MKTGIVIELSAGRAVILSADGEFTTVHAHSEWKKGEVVRFYVNKKRTRVLSLLAACFLLLFLAGGTGALLYFTPVSLVSIDVNPSIELSLNRFDRVISAKALNRDGTQILKQNGLQYLTYADAIERILQAETKDGYLTDSSKVVVTVSSTDDQKQAVLAEAVTAAADTAVEGCHSNAQVEGHSVDQDTVDGAHRYGVTAGKYLYLELLKEAASDIDLSDFSHHSIEDIEIQIDACEQAHGSASSGGIVQDSADGTDDNSDDGGSSEGGNTDGSTSDTDEENTARGHQHRHGHNNHE